MVHTGGPADPGDDEIRAGAGLMRPLEAAARKAGVEILLEHRMTAIHREAANVRPRVIGIAVDAQGHEAQHPRPQGRHRRHRRLDRQRQFPPHVRSAPDRGILRARRHAVVGSGRQRRTRRHGDRRRAVGLVQLHRRIRLRHHQAGRDRLPIRLCQCALASGQRGVRQGARHRAAGGGLAGRHPGQHAGQALLRRDRRPLQLQHLSEHQSLRAAHLSQRQEPEIQSEQFHQRRARRHRRRP